ncbi:MAG: TetR/AcrR family transcriptional regulator [Burkholderiaceae bacterium]|nr:TetR/AcrR family transcriptional regulator [Burkholderiaceae bacterium]
MSVAIEQSSTRSARQSGASAENPRARILKAAARLFRRKGFKGTTVRDIAEAAGILSGSLFYHFATKEEMLLEIMREAFVSMCVAHEMALATESDPVNQLRALVQGELEAILSENRQDFHAVLYFDWREAPVAAMPELNRLRKRYQRCWARALQGCHDAGRLRCAPDIAERVIDGALRGVMTWFRKGGRYTTQEFGDAFAHLFVD